MDMSNVNSGADGFFGAVPPKGTSPVAQDGFGMVPEKTLPLDGFAAILTEKSGAKAAVTEADLAALLSSATPETANIEAALSVNQLISSEGQSLVSKTDTLENIDALLKRVSALLGLSVDSEKSLKHIDPEYIPDEIVSQLADFLNGLKEFSQLLQKTGESNVSVLIAGKVVQGETVLEVAKTLNSEMLKLEVECSKLGISSRMASVSDGQTKFSAKGVNNLQFAVNPRDLAGTQSVPEHLAALFNREESELEGMIGAIRQLAAAASKSEMTKSLSALSGSNKSASNSLESIVSPVADAGTAKGVPVDPLKVGGDFVKVPLAEGDTVSSVPAELAKATTVPTELAKTTTVPTELAKATTVPTELAKATTVPTELAKATTVPAELAKTTAVPTELAKAATVPTELAKAATVPTELAKTTTVPSELAKASVIPAEIVATVLSEEVVSEVVGKSTDLKDLKLETSQSEKNLSQVLASGNTEADSEMSDEDDSDLSEAIASITSALKDVNKKTDSSKSFEKELALSVGKSAIPVADDPVSSTTKNASGIESVFSTEQLVKPESVSSVTSEEASKKFADVVSADSLNFSSSLADKTEIVDRSVAVTKVEKVYVPRSFEQIVVDQVSGKVLESTKTGTREVTLILKPEFLGEVKITIQVQGDVVSAKLNVESQQVKNIIDNNLQSLKDSLTAHNLTAGSLDVNVGSGDDHRTADDQKNQRRRKSNFGGNQELAGGDQFIPDTFGQETGRRYGSNTLEYFA